MRKLGESEKPPTKEKIEEQKKIVDDLYKKEKEERESYLESIAEERKKTFEESKGHISDIIDEKAFMIDRQKEREAQRIELRPNIEGIGEKILGTIERQANRIGEQYDINMRSRDIKNEAKENVKKSESEVDKLREDDED